MNILDQTVISQEACTEWHRICAEFVQTADLQPEFYPEQETAEILSDGSMKVFIPNIPEVFIVIPPAEWTWNN